jgi:ABC-2 type transport system ATP-binding protein
MIVINNLSKSYGKNEVLREIHMQFEAGKVYGIVGENGSGKTTFFKCIAGLESYAGSIEPDYKMLKNHLGLLPTNPYFMSRITGWEYLKLVCVARGIKSEDFAEQNVFELPLNQYAETYSTGMKKKLALTGILLQKNDVFILDEPFNGVDIHSNMIISELIQRLKSLGKTMLISSHIFSTLNENCDIIHLLHKGKFVKSAEKNEFAALENRMKDFVLGNKIDNINLQ